MKRFINYSNSNSNSNSNSHSKLNSNSNSNTTSNSKSNSNDRWLAEEAPSDCNVDKEAIHPPECHQLRFLITWSSNGSSNGISNGMTTSNSDSRANSTVEGARRLAGLLRQAQALLRGCRRELRGYVNCVTYIYIYTHR